jgi:hypothetical protein
MTRRTIRIRAAVLSGSALLAVTGCGGSGGGGTPAQSTSGGQSTPGAQSAQQPARAGGPFSQANLSALAKDLGVTSARLQQALAAARPAGAGNGTPPSGGQGSGRPPAGAGGRGGQLAAGLAKQLNLPADQVQQALNKVMPGRPQGPAGQAPSATPGQN